MLKNIFSKRLATTTDFSVATQESLMENFSDTELSDFMLLEEATMNQAVIENVRHMYLGEREDCVEIIQESASDFLNNMVEFFKRLLAKIKEWFGKIFLLIQTLIGNTGKILEQNKDTFLKKNARFDMLGFEYSIKDGVPKMEPLDKMISEYNKEISKIKDISMKDINERRDDFKGSIHKLRGEILTTNGSIEGGELRETADAFFRKGETDSSTITIDNAYIQKIASEYSGIKKTYTDCVKEKRQLEVQLESLKKFFENGARQVKYDSNGEKVIKTSGIERKDTHVARTGDETNHIATTSTLKLLNSYYNFRYEQSKEMSSIILTILESKVRALKEQLKFYDTCVRKWITVPNNSQQGGVNKEDKSKDKDGEK